jgi:hypothetical protein
MMVLICFMIVMGIWRGLMRAGDFLFTSDQKLLSVFCSSLLPVCHCWQGCLDAMMAEGLYSYVVLCIYGRCWGR